MVVQMLMSDELMLIVDANVKDELSMLMVMLDGNIRDELDIC